jgi:hypothetical protein
MTTEKIAYEAMRNMAVALGGTLVYVRTGPRNRWGKWVLTIGQFSIDIPATGEQKFPLLDACYALKPGHTYRTFNDRDTTMIDPAGVAHLFSRLGLRIFNNGGFHSVPPAE